jgi:ATP-binding cassette subfamily C (CFTR/MRP) protein 4
MKPEPVWKSSEKDEPTQIPVSGRIEFRNVVVRYKPDAPSVLKNLSFKIESGQKIGVVGRTGAGNKKI